MESDTPGITVSVHRNRRGARGAVVHLTDGAAVAVGQADPSHMRAINQAVAIALENHAAKEAKQRNEARHEESGISQKGSSLSRLADDK